MAVERKSEGVWQRVTAATNTWLNRVLKTPAYYHLHGRSILAYVREEGAIAYEVYNFFSNTDFINHLNDDLSNSHLYWFWESERREEPSEHWKVQNLPKRRPLTQWTDGTRALLIGDLSERDVDGYGRGLTLIGTTEVLNAQDTNSHLQQFVTETGPIEIVIIQVGDLLFDVIFTKHLPDHKAMRLLSKWGVGRELAVKIKPYKKLGMLSLESGIQHATVDR